MGSLRGCRTVIGMSSCTVCHIEYSTEDMGASRRFCEGLFGWEFREFGDTMQVFGTPEGHIGGFTKGGRSTGGMSPEVSYRVESVDGMVEKAKQLGGAVSTEKRAVPGVGFYAAILAPDGNEFGLVEFTDRG